MTQNEKIHHRRSIRYQGYDYSQVGAYFITLCTQNKACLFWDMSTGKAPLNAAGMAATQCWLAIPDHFPHVELDAWVIMPNHIHGILLIVDTPPVEMERSSPRPGTTKTIGSIVRGFKIGVTKWMRNNTLLRDIWQRNYWEHVIRNEQELNKVREYIVNNPTQWECDTLNPNVKEKLFSSSETWERYRQCGNGTSRTDGENWMT